MLLDLREMDVRFDADAPLDEDEDEEEEEEDRDFALDDFLSEW